MGFPASHRRRGHRHSGLKQISAPDAIGQELPDIDVPHEAHVDFSLAFQPQKPVDRRRNIRAADVTTSTRREL